MAVVGPRTRARGELEQAVMAALWHSAEPLSARDIQEALTGECPAYTTVITTLDRLEKKGLVTRQAESPRKVRFAPTRSEVEHASHSMMTALADAGDRRAALLKFTGDLDDDDLEALRTAVNAARSPRRS